MKIFHCTIHNCDFGANIENSGLIRCPLCVAPELDELRTELQQAKEQRDDLLKAIEIKQEALRKEKREWLQEQEHRR